MKRIISRVECANANLRYLCQWFLFTFILAANHLIISWISLGNVLFDSLRISAMIKCLRRLDDIFAIFYNQLITYTCKWDLRTQKWRVRLCNSPKPMKMVRFWFIAAVAQDSQGNMHKKKNSKCVALFMKWRVNVSFQICWCLSFMQFVIVMNQSNRGTCFIQIFYGSALWNRWGILQAQQFNGTHFGE